MKTIKNILLYLLLGIASLMGCSCSIDSVAALPDGEAVTVPVVVPAYMQGTYIEHTLPYTGKGETVITLTANGINAGLTAYGGPEVSMQLTTANAFGQDLRQLTEQLPQLRTALKDAFGTVDTEKISKSGITGKEVVQALTKEFSKLPKVTGGINNAFENLRDNAKISFANIGESINKAFDIEGKINKVSDTFRELTERFKKLEPGTQKLALVFTGLTAAIGPTLLGIGAIVKLVPVFISGMQAVSTAIAFASANFVTIAAVIGVAFLAYKAFAGQSEKINSLQERQNHLVKLSKTINEEATKSIVDQKVKLSQLVDTARDESKTKEEKLAAIKEINKISPEYLGNISLETINTDAATAAIEKYNEALLKGAKARAAQKALEDLYKRQIEQAKELELNKAKATEQEQKLKKATEGSASLNALRQDQQKNAAKFGAIATKEAESRFKKEEQFLLDTINNNKEYLSLLEAIGLQSGNNAGIGLGNTKRPKLEPIKLPEIQGSNGSIAAIDEQINKLRDLQQNVSRTSETYQLLEKEIAGLEFGKQTLIDPTALIQVDDFTDRVYKSADDLKGSLINLNETAALMSTSVGDAFAGMTGRFVDSLGLASTGMEGFLKTLASTVTQLISMMLAQAISQSIAGATASGTATGPGAVFTTPAFIATAVSGVIAAFAAIPKFADGGIVGGNSFYGDKILARVNSGELMLNQKQQQRLAGMLEPAGSNVNITLDGGFKIDGNDLRLVLDRIAKRNERTR